MASGQGLFFAIPLLLSCYVFHVCVSSPVLNETRLRNRRFHHHLRLNDSVFEKVLGPPSNNRLLEGLRPKGGKKLLLRSSQIKNKRPHRLRTGGIESSSKNCSHNAFIACLNLGNPFDISDLIAKIGTTDLILPSNVLISSKNSLREKLADVCAATEPIVNCLAKASCLDDSAPSDAPVWKSLFAGAQPQQARLLPNWVKSLRYLPVACEMLLKRNGAVGKVAPKQITTTPPQPATGLSFDFNSLDKCPEFTENLFREECGGSDLNADRDLTDVRGFVADPWKTPSSSLSAATLQWIDLEFLELLKADDFTGQVNFSALPYISETTCVYLNRKIDCFTVQVYRYCEVSIQDAIITALLKFVNFQLLISNSKCSLLSEKPEDLRRVLAINENTQNMKSLSFVDNVMDKKEETIIRKQPVKDPTVTVTTRQPPQVISVTLALEPPTTTLPSPSSTVKNAEAKKIRDEVLSLIRSSSTSVFLSVHHCSNLLLLLLLLLLCLFCSNSFSSKL